VCSYLQQQRGFEVVLGNHHPSEIVSLRGDGRREYHKKRGVAGLNAVIYLGKRTDTVGHLWSKKSGPGKDNEKNKKEL